MKTLLPSLAFLLVVAAAHGQDATAAMAASPASLPAQTDPDAPTPQATANGQPSSSQAQSQATPQQTKRILGIFPNFRATSTDTKLPPQSVKEKFKTGFEDSFDYSAFIFVGLQAGVSEGSDSYPAFHQGAPGYARYYWHTFADQADENFWVESIIPAALHEDSRYYTLGHGGFFKRAGYAFSRALITRNDSGSNTFNVGEIVGAGAAAGISSTYYPTQYCTWTKTGQRWLTNITLDSATFVVREFWPNINRAVFHRND
jgi:hypothetical protein